MLLRHNARLRSNWFSAATLHNCFRCFTMRQKPNDDIVAWAKDLAAQGTDPNEMMKRLLKAGWLFDAALAIMQPHYPDWVARQPRSVAAAPLSLAQRLQKSLGMPQ